MLDTQATADKEKEKGNREEGRKVQKQRAQTESQHSASLFKKGAHSGQKSQGEETDYGNAVVSASAATLGDAPLA